MKFPIIVYVHIARIVASLFSIAGGFVYTVNIVGLITSNNIIKITTASIMLVLLELGGVLFLYKSISDILRKKKQIYIYLLPALAFLSLSFLLTTNGAVMWLKQKNNKQTELQKNAQKSMSKTALFYENEIRKNKAIYDSIASEKLNKWKTARELQITKLQFYASEIARLEKNNTIKRKDKLQKLHTAIASNKSATKRNSKKYYWLAVIIMLSVFYFNFLLVWLKFKQEKQKDVCTETNVFFNNNNNHQEKEQNNGQKNTDIKTQILELAGTMKQKEIAEKLGVHPSKVSRTIKKNK